MRGDLVANVANGSVILSGRVENIEIARDVVKQVKEIPGIKQISFELGLKMKFPSNIGVGWLANKSNICILRKTNN